MATNRPTGYGLSRELAEKNAAKYSVEDEVRDCDALYLRSIYYSEIHICSFKYAELAFASELALSLLRCV